MLLRVQHETKLSYSEPVSETVFDVRMAPPSDEDQTNLGYRLRIVPSAPVTIYRDGFGNRVDLFNIFTPYSELVIRATSIVRTHRGNAPESRLCDLLWQEKPAEQMPLESLEYLEPSPLANRCAELDQFLAALPKPEGALSDVIERMMAAVASALVYEKKVTTARTPVGEALRLGRGVCQDYAHLFLAACRGIGLPARYVSGYIHQPGEVATHAWCQVWTGNGWLDIDPTRSTFAGDDYITIAVGRDYSDVPPNRGVWKGRAEETIAVSVKVEPIDRVPPDWSDWSGIQAPWSASSWVQSQSRLERARLNPQAGYRQQQGQQQQTSAPGGRPRGTGPH
jgi:transglutaminase-like putative cysteine protease